MQRFSKPVAWLLLVSLWVAWSPMARCDQVMTIYESELNRLIEIQQQLETLNEKLQGELTASRLDLSGATESSEALRTEISGLRTELESSNKRVDELLTNSTASLEESKQLREAQATAQALSEKAEASWKEYEKGAEAKIKKLETDVWLAGIVSGILAFLFGWLIGKATHNL